ncbi:plasma membrane heat shock protein [Yamadazyma tenuis]|uniref:D-lactate dehydratase n=1 Tax=Candida tenuis (strain ATCC 10573 / BCRC 21748 / CBS 615 / JCM 9827 / NBRC 10315 / NRRL Y-1498 / VKM Y-70) TaxID=590646 RepID=G3BEM2_CANTC|nr:class I glutamine amidotransferase-like protein [Yamadazyma tenuis ATCC 10573]XP_006690164.1 uncharacterized protein CANTEDRAFT_115959 [Yamadazyma tenuis ATCC 10573]EGV60949.1 class I glutamine amidotransferase-like protein [Yamadazyma tenuis ATCC 10573]EGV60950.1 hypothetical protein CANTEDRAFT_115959 [Yamadazyma tenuis ATCC 10573]WEJ94851.1 plasma membrane heat shock protein [Yamadazyma tenuis]
MPSVLIALPSYHGPFFNDGTTTGTFAVEVIHPFEAFKAKGYDIDFASRTGSFGYDDHSLTEDFLKGDDKAILEDPNSEYNITLKKIKKASDVNPKDYDIFFAVGGYGASFDFPTATDVVKVAEDIYANGGVVAAVCHGPAIFTNMKDPSTGKPLIAGKNVTGFTDEGEKLFDTDKPLVKYNLDTMEGVAKKTGANFKLPGAPFDDFTVTDGRVVTGVNPASAGSTARAAIIASQQ